MSVDLHPPNLLASIEGLAMAELFSGSIHGHTALFDGCTVLPTSHGFDTFREMLEHLRDQFKRGKRLVFHEFTASSTGLWISYAVLP